jgi:hypothetical protein
MVSAHRAQSAKFMPNYKLATGADFQKPPSAFIAAARIRRRLFCQS